MKRGVPAAIAAVMWLATTAAAVATPGSVEEAIDTAKQVMASTPDRSLRLAQHAEREARALPSGAARDRDEATALWLQGEALGRLNALDRAAPIVAHARAIAQRVARSGKLEGDILLTQGSIKGGQARVTEALQAFVAAHRIFVTIGDTRNQAISLVCIAGLYTNAKDYQAALRYLTQALDAYRADPAMAVSIYNNQGIILDDQHSFAKADVAFGQALRIARSIDNRAMAAQILRNAARNQLKAGRLAAADRSIAAGRALSRGAGGDETAFYAVAAEAALQHHRPTEAATLIERSFAGTDLTTTTLPFRDAHQTAFAVYGALGRPDKALVHLAALKRLDDDATKLATQTNTALMAARFDSANQDARIARLKLEEAQRAAAYAQQRARAERMLFLGGAGATALVIVLLLVGLFTIRRSRDQVRAANDDLAVTNSALGKALAAKTEFLATTSHEIRTPLNGILGMTEVMLTDRQLSPPARERLSVVHGAGLTMRALVDDILDVAKMETGNLAIETAPFALRTTLAGAATMWRDQAQAKELSFVADLSRCPERVVGDAGRVRQIVFNLLSNALKFTAEGQVALTAVADGNSVTITVADSGIGIAPAKHDEVFESFRQADTSTTRQFGGTGLGLSICRNLARAMGGEVTLSSSVGRGSTFTVVLPLEVLAAAEEIAAGRSEHPLMIVDRNPITRAMLRNILAPQANTIVAAASLDEALAGVATATPSAILIDDGAARADGDPHAFLAALRAAAPQVPVTLLWPAATDAERDALLAVGASRIVTKPVTGAALVAILFPVVDTLVSRAA